MSENLPVVQFLSNWFDELESTFANLRVHVPMQEGPSHYKCTAAVHMKY